MSSHCSISLLSFGCMKVWGFFCHSSRHKIVSHDNEQLSTFSHCHFYMWSMMFWTLINLILKVFSLCADVFQSCLPYANDTSQVPSNQYISLSLLGPFLMFNFPLMIPIMNLLPIKLAEKVGVGGCIIYCLATRMCIFPLVIWGTKAHYSSHCTQMDFELSQFSFFTSLAIRVPVITIPQLMCLITYGWKFILFMCFVLFWKTQLKSTLGILFL